MSDSEKTKTTAKVKAPKPPAKKADGDDAKKAAAAKKTAKKTPAKKGAKGDVRSKSRKLEPYAYWPLDPKLLNRRASKRASAKEGLGRVVRNAKAAGIFHGQKARDEEARK